jgi:uncharacterized protein YqgC (DUF456 family)
MALDILLWILSTILVIAGVVGLVIPALPGAPIIFAGLLLAAWVEHFEFVGWGTLAILAVLAVLTYAVDFVAGAFGAKKFGASNRSVVGAALGGLVGLFFGLPGVVIGPFAGAVLGELSHRRTLSEAGKAGVGATVGLALGVAAKLALAFTMIGIFLVVRFF